MELAELKDLWSAYDRKLDRVVRLNTLVLRQTTLNKAKRSLHWMVALLSLELTGLAVVLVWLGHFWGTRLDEPRFAIPGIAMHLATIGLAALRAHQIITIASIDYGAPIVAIQQRIERVRLDRIRLAKWGALLLLPIFAPAMIVGARGLLGIDLWEAFGTPWIVANLAFGIAVSAILYLVARRFGERARGGRFVRGLVRDISGVNLNAAVAHLRECEAYEVE